MRIAYLCSDFGVAVSGSKGASIHVRALSQALRALGHEVVVFTPRSGGEAAAHFDVPVRELPLERVEEIVCDLLRWDPNGGESVATEMRAALYATSFRHRARALLRDFRPDLIYERYSLFGTAGAALARDLDVPLILEVNAPLADEQAAHRGSAFAETARQLERTILCWADRVIVVSPALERWLVGLGVEPERVTVLANGVDPARFETGGERDALRARLGLVGQSVVGFLGTLKPWHDTPTLIRAVALLRRRGLAARLLVLGDGPERDGLEELARREGISAATTFAGAVSHERVPAYLAALDVAAAPYRRTGGFYFSPLKLFEYLAAGLPVVAADVGEIHHCVRPGETGCLYRPGDVEGLAEALGALLADSTRAASLGRAGRAHVCAHHTWEGNARAVIDLARRALGAGAAP